MKALTIRQPWATLIMAGHKPVENRTWVAGLRGPLVIHAGAGWDDHAWSLSLRLLGRRRVDELWRTAERRRTLVLGVVDVVDMHSARTCDGCSPWAEAGERINHWVMADPIELDAPLVATGRLGLWDVPPSIELAVHRATEAVS